MSLKISVALLMLAGMIKCYRISRLPNVNRKCVFALVVFLLGATMGQLFSVLSGTFPIARICYLLFSLLIFSIALLSIFLAVTGLLEVSANRDAFLRGKKQARWAIALSVLNIGILGFGLYRGIEGSERIPSEILQELQSDMLGGSFEKPLVFKNFNFQLRPPRPWVSLNAAKVNPNATVVLLRSNPQMYFMVIAETFGSQETNTESTAEFAKANLESRSTSFHLLEEKPYLLLGVPGIRIVADATVSAQPQTFVYWVYAKNGFAYKLAAFSPKSQLSVQAAQDMAESIFKHFELIDRNRVSDGFQKSLLLRATNFRSEKFGYSITGEKTEWKTWATLSKDMPDAEFGMLRGSAAFMVVPISLMGKNPELDDLTHGLLSLMDIEYPNSQISGLRKVHAAGLDGNEFRYQRTLDHVEYSYKLAVLRNRTFAYLISSWADKDTASRSWEDLEDVHSLVQFQKADSPGLKTFSSQERDTHSKVFNQIGLALFDRRKFLESVDYFKTGFEIDKSDANILSNVVQAYKSVEKYQDAYDYLNSYIVLFPEDQSLVLKRAFLEENLGKKEDALKNYHCAFSLYHRDDQYFNRYVNLLWNERRKDEAFQKSIYI